MQDKNPIVEITVIQFALLAKDVGQRDGHDASSTFEQRTLKIK